MRDVWFKAGHSYPQENSDVWVVRQSNLDPVLAYYSLVSMGKDKGKLSRFQSIYSVDDRSGLYVEIYHDVIAWTYVHEPKYTGLVLI
jgi:hypothetical protein